MRRSKTAVAGAEGIQYGTLSLHMDQTRQRMSNVQVGIVDVRRRMHERDTEALAQWVILDRIAMLTGHFCTEDNTSEFVSELAVRTNAVSWTPMYQAVSRKPQSRLLMAAAEWMHPSFFLLYGCYGRLVVRDPEVAVVPATLDLGDALWEEMLSLSQRPVWSNNDQGSAFVANLGTITMKPPDWTRWFDHCFQTVLWIGSAIPSYSSQQKCIDRSRGKGKGKGKGPGKGGKGKFPKGQGLASSKRRIAPRWRS